MDRRAGDRSARVPNIVRRAPEGRASTQSAAGSRPAALVACRNGGNTLAAHRAHDALLAQPLRLGTTEGALGAADVPPERAAAPACRRQFPGAAARDRARPGNGGLSRFSDEPARQAERKLRARSDGALHARTGPLHRDRHQGVRPRLHWIQPRSRNIGLCLPPGFPRRREQDRARRHGSAHRRRRARHPAGAACGGGFHRRQAVARVRFADAGSGAHRPDCAPIPR